MAYVFRNHRTLAVLASALLCAAAWTTAPLDAAAKRKSRPAVPPDLRILSVTTMPDPYVPGAGPLDVRVELELPDDVAAGTLLDVSALIESPSKRSMRFLSNRQPVETHPSGGAAEGSTKPRIMVILSWDGTDHRRQYVGSGRFTYDVKAKLLTVGDRGPRTFMTSWPRHGSITVLEPLGRPEPATGP